MKAIMIVGLLALAIEMSAAEDQKSEASKESFYTVPARTRAAGLALRDEARNEIVLKRVTLKGPMIALVKNEGRLQTFNPFTPAKGGSDPEDFRNDPYLGRPRGIVLFSIGF
ncbi:MAG TPA: hypothetical protein VJW76_10535 [Verrucomicrobiae bacterium]|nr:hypothetical protein [Verrucomicrobiae bacterium]